MLNIFALDRFPIAFCDAKLNHFISLDQNRHAVQCLRGLKLRAGSQFKDVKTQNKNKALMIGDQFGLSDSKLGGNTLIALLRNQMDEFSWCMLIPCYLSSQSGLIICLHFPLTLGFVNISGLHCSIWIYCNEIWGLVPRSSIVGPLLQTRVPLGLLYIVKTPTVLTQ